MRKVRDQVINRRKFLGGATCAALSTVTVGCSSTGTQGFSVNKPAHNPLPSVDYALAYAPVTDSDVDLPAFGAPTIATGIPFFIALPVLKEWIKR